MESISIQEWIAAGIVGLYLLGRVFRLLGWDRGAGMADELRDALQGAGGLIDAARSGSTEAIALAAETAASKLRGLDADDVLPIVENLVKHGGDSRNGVTVSLDSQGKISVDTTGAVVKAGGKLAKWLRKVF